MCDRAVVIALAKVLDRVAYWLEADDENMTATCSRVVSLYMAHPSAVALADDICWRRQLARWRGMRGRVPTPTSEVSDYATHLANVLLIEATREVERGEVTVAA